MLGWEPAVALDEGLRRRSSISGCGEARRSRAVKQKILLTGAAGFIGSHLSEALIARGAEVPGGQLRCLLRARGQGAQPGRAAPTARLPLRRGGRRPRSDAARWRGGVIHLAAKPGVRPSLEDPGAYMEANVTGHRPADRRGAPGGDTRIVFGSSSSVLATRRRRRLPRRARRLAISPSPLASARESCWPMRSRISTRSDHLPAVLYRVRPRQRPDLAIHKFSRLIARGRPVRMHAMGRVERDYSYITDALEWHWRPGMDGAGGARRRRDGESGWRARVRLDRLIALIAKGPGAATPDRAPPRSAGGCAG